MTQDVRLLREEVEDRRDSVRLEPEQRVRPEPDRDGALSRAPKREARHAEVCGFLLNPARVGEHCHCIAYEGQKLEVAERRHEPYAAVAALVDSGVGAWMNRENDGEVGCEGVKVAQCDVELVAVDERRSVEGHEQVLASFEAEGSCGVERAEVRLEDDE